MNGILTQRTSDFVCDRLNKHQDRSISGAAGPITRIVATETKTLQNQQRWYSSRQDPPLLCSMLPGESPQGDDGGQRRRPKRQLSLLRRDKKCRSPSCASFSIPYRNAGPCVDSSVGTSRLESAASVKEDREGFKRRGHGPRRADSESIVRQRRRKRPKLRSVLML